MNWKRVEWERKREREARKAPVALPPPVKAAKQVRRAGCVIRRKRR